MSTATALRREPPAARSAEGLASARPAPAPERRADLFAYVGPNWFASVMGTGILANAAALLPVQVSALHVAALAIWVLSAALLVVLLLATAIHWARHPQVARSHANNPVMAQFYGAPPMAILTVGSGALLLGRDLIGLHAAVLLDGSMWAVGTVAALASSAAIPYLAFTRHRVQQSDTLASWLMPVVPPMVAAAAGAGLVAHLPEGQLRLTLIFACVAMFGLSAIAALIVISLVWARLSYHGTGPATTIPTLWIVLGPLGTSITVAGLLANDAPASLPAAYSHVIGVAGMLYGVPVWGFAMLWVTIAAAITLRAIRTGLPFTLTWWSFTFPVGTIVTGTSVLAVQTHLAILDVASVGFYAFLAIAWAVVSVRTVSGVISGRLLAPPPGQVPAPPSGGVPAPPSGRVPAPRSARLLATPPQAS